MKASHAFLLALARFSREIFIGTKNVSKNTCYRRRLGRYTPWRRMQTEQV